MVLCQADTNKNGELTPAEFLAYKRNDMSGTLLECLPTGCDPDEFLAMLERVFSGFSKINKNNTF